MPLQQFDERVPFLDSERFLDSDTPGTYKSVLDGMLPLVLRLDTIQLLNADTIDHNVSLSANNDGSLYLMSGLVPAGSGFGAVPPVDLLALALPAAYHYVMPSSYGIWWTVSEAVGAGKAVRMILAGGFM